MGIGINKIRKHFFLFSYPLLFELWSLETFSKNLNFRNLNCLNLSCLVTKFYSNYILRKFKFNKN